MIRMHTSQLRSPCDRAAILTPLNIPCIDSAFTLSVAKRTPPYPLPINLPHFNTIYFPSSYILPPPSDIHHPSSCIFYQPMAIAVAGHLVSCLLPTTPVLPMASIINHQLSIIIYHISRNVRIAHILFLFYQSAWHSCFVRGISISARIPGEFKVFHRHHL